MFCYHRLTETQGCKIWVCEAILDAFKLHLNSYQAEYGCIAISSITDKNTDIGARFTVLGACEALARVILINEHKDAVKEACRTLAILTASEQNRARAIEDGVIAAVEFARETHGGEPDVLTYCNSVLRNLD